MTAPAGAGADIETHSDQGRNPLLPAHVHVPDAEARVMPDGRLYLYGSLDQTVDGYCSDRYRVASTADMVTWTVHPPSFRTDDIPWVGVAPPSGRSFLEGVSSFAELPARVRAMLPPAALDVPFEEFATAVRAETAARQPKSPRLYAPDAIERDGRVHLYFCMSDGTQGVATSESPTGPFIIASRLPISGIDPAVFIDDDGQAYLYWGQFSADAARLNRDMTSLDESSIIRGLITEDEHHFHEGISVRKKGDTYYLVFTDTSRGRPTCLGYATSSSPLGPFEYRGVIIDNAGCDPETWNNHGSIERVGDQWFVFYHRSSRGSSSMRRACAEPISFRSDGTIAEVTMTSQGAGAAYRLGEAIPARAACELSGTVRITPADDGSEVLAGASDGDVVHVRYLDCAAAVRSVRGTLRGDGEVIVLAAGTPVATLSAAAPRQPIHLPPGRYEITLKMNWPRRLEIIDIRFDA